MAPRGRAKKRLKRIDAAIDALVPMGFSKSSICKTVNELLKVYGGDSGWAFIEEASYKLVIEMLLEQQEQEKCSVQRGDPCGDGISAPDIAENSSAALTSEVAEGEAATIGLLGYVGWKNISCDNKSILEQADTGAADEAGPSCSQQVRTVSHLRRKPCYGWISDDGDEKEDNEIGGKFSPEDGFIQSISDMGQKRKRKTRWDVKPEDMHEWFHTTHVNFVRSLT